MKNMEKPKYEIVMFDTPDIIVTSGDAFIVDGDNYIWLSIDDINYYNEINTGPNDLYTDGYEEDGYKYFAFSGSTNRKGEYFFVKFLKEEPSTLIILKTSDDDNDDNTKTSYDVVYNWLLKTG